MLGKAIIKKYDCESVVDDWDDFKSVVQVGRDRYVWVKYRQIVGSYFGGH